MTQLEKSDTVDLDSRFYYDVYKTTNLANS